MLVTSLMMLVVLLILGIAATNTTVLELQISGNDKISRQTFYRADAVAREAMGYLLVDDLDDAPVWMLSVDNALMPAVSSNPADIAAEQDAVRDDAIWNRDIDGDSVLDNSLMSQVYPDTQMMIAHRGVAPGSSLSLGTSRLHVFAAYGRSRQNNSLAIIKTGFRNSYQN